MKAIIIRVAAVLIGITGIGILADTIAERTADRVIGKLTTDVSEIEGDDDDDEPLEADEIN